MSQEQFQDLGGSVRALRIILFSLMCGAVIYLGLVLYLRFGAGVKMLDGSLFTMLATATALPLVFFQAVLPRLITAGARRALASKPPGTDAVELLKMYHVQTIIGAALCEGGAFFCLLAYQMEGQWFGLIPAVILLALIAARWPSEARVRDWMVRQYEQVAELRHGAGT